MHTISEIHACGMLIALVIKKSSRTVSLKVGSPSNLETEKLHKDGGVVT